MLTLPPRATFEEWRPTHNSSYEVSNFGRVRSWTGPGGSKASGWRTRLEEPRILRGSKRAFGYPSVIFYPEVQGHAVHRLVARAFIGPCPPGQEVMHKDDNPLNARADNLEYGTSLQNNHDKIARGRFTRRKLTEDQVRDIRARLEALPRTGPAHRIPNGSCKVLAREFGVSERCIEAVWWRHNYKRV